MISEIKGTLMNRDIPVLKIEGILKINEARFYEIVFTKEEILNELMCPIVVNKTLSAERNLANLNYWFNKRLMSKKRTFKKVKELTFDELYPHFLCMSDHYWIQYDNEKWEDVSYFFNVPDKSLGEFSFSKNPNIEKFHITNNAPELTTNGIQNKRWVLKAEMPMGNLYALRKRNSKKLGTEVYSDVLATAILKKLGTIEFVPYNLVIDENELASECLNFINVDTELVTATSLLSVVNKKENENIYDTLIRIGDIYHIPGVSNHIDTIINVNEILHNEDCNTGNIAFIRNREGKFIGGSPIYDFGFAFLTTDGKVKNIFEQRRIALKSKDKLIKISKKEIEKIMEDYNFGIDNDNFKEIVETRLHERENGVRYSF